MPLLMIHSRRTLAPQSSGASSYDKYQLAQVLTSLELGQVNFELAFGHCQSGLDTATISCQKPIVTPAHATTDLGPGPMSNGLFPMLRSGFQIVSWDKALVATTRALLPEGL